MTSKSVPPNHRPNYSPSQLEQLVHIRTAELVAVNIQLQQEIEERKKIEAALRESEARYRSVVTALRGGIVLQDQQGQILTCNASAEAILGLTEAQMMGRTSLDPRWRTIHGDGSSFPGDEHPTVVSLKTGQPCIDVLMGVHKPTGELTWIMVNSQPLFLPGADTPYAAVASFADVTASRSAEQQIREQAALLDIATDAIFVRDLDHRISFWNQSAERLYGWSATEVLGQSILALLYPDNLAAVDEVIARVLSRSTWQGELTQRTKLGKSVVVLSRWTLVRNAAGEPKSILTVNTDITEKKQLEAQFLRTQRLESIGTLASGIAHDLNNVLTPILASAQLLPLKNPQLDPQSQQLLQMLETSARRGSDLVKQVLSFARGGEGQPGPLNLQHVIAEVAQFCRQTFPKSITLDVNLVGAERWMVLGEATQLHQVLMNLCVNARDAMVMLNGGMLTIALTHQVVDAIDPEAYLPMQLGQYVVLSVKDTGVGISQEIIDRVFEPFFTTKAVGQGTGLGLSTVLGIVQNHGGFMTIASEPGKGSQFNVFLPAIAHQQVMPTVTESQGSLEGDDELILIVDDEAAIRQITQVVLDSSRYRTLLAANGMEAIRLYASHQADIKAVLMDVMMPTVGGITTIRSLQEVNPDVKVIACSGLSSNQAMIDNSGLKVQAFLPKPYTANELLLTLRRVLA
jgi:PAS domain S-box-containing protein